MGGTMTNNPQTNTSDISQCEQSICQYPTDNSVNVNANTSAIHFITPDANPIQLNNIMITEDGQIIPTDGILVTQIVINKPNALQYYLTVNLHAHSKYVITYSGLTSKYTNEPIPVISYKFSTT